MGQLVLSGTLQGGPPNGTDIGPGPRMSLNVPLAFKGGSWGKSYNAATGILQRSVSTGVYLQLAGVSSSASDPVTKGDTLYLLTNGPVSFRLTTDDGSGGNVVAVVPVDGFAMWEFPGNKFLKLLEVLGSASIEYFVSGQQ